MFRPDSTSTTETLTFSRSSITAAILADLAKEGNIIKTKQWNEQGTKLEVVVEKPAAGPKKRTPRPDGGLNKKGDE